MQRVEHSEKTFAGDAGQAINALLDELVDENAAAGAGVCGCHWEALFVRTTVTERLTLILRSIAQRCVSKDEATASASWFETPAFRRLLTMRRTSGHHAAASVDSISLIQYEVP
jgi:hypothetical protein